MTAGFRNNLVLAGIGSLALSALAPLPTLAAPGITLQGSFAADRSNGSDPQAALTAAGNGLYYGITVNSSDSSPAIYAFDSATGSITLQGYFDPAGSNGFFPYAALTAAGNGLYYGTASEGGAGGKGTIFAFDSTTGSITTMASFAADGANGAQPYAELISAGNGLYYGTTIGGGANGTGAIYAFDSTTSSITLQASFNNSGNFGSNGNTPYAALTAAGNGLYYGTTKNGGTGGKGVIYAFDPTAGSITRLASFAADGSNGANPESALTPAGNGIYYGTAFLGGANNLGAIFAFDSATGSIILQDSFAADLSNGAYPRAALTSAGNGIYYGGTSYGGQGTIFSFDAASGHITLQASVVPNYSNGSFPSELTPAGNGLYFVTSPNGSGANNTGAIFAFDSGVRDSNPVPGPLPLMGAGAAFGWSRKLRRRIQQVRPVFPMGR